MKLASTVLLATCLLGGAAASPVDQWRPKSHSSHSHSPTVPICNTGEPFAKPVGRLFDYGGGDVSYFAGTNVWWLAFLENNSDIDTVLDEIVNTNLKVVRMWGFSDVNSDPGPGNTWFQLLSSSGAYINYSPVNGIPRIDYAVYSAEKRGIKLVMNFVNNWNSLGGIPTYNAAFGGNTTSWYTDAQSQQVYHDYINLLVNRYKNSSAIFAWELANEPRCMYCPTSVITNWATEISQYIKSLDPDHMVTLGDEGWFAPNDNIGDGSYAYDGSNGIDFNTNLKIPTLDYGVFHLYPDSWGYNETWGSTWIVEHNEVGAAIGKPVVAEEYGGPPTPHNHTSVEVPWQMTILNDTQLAMDQFWQFGTPYLSTGPSLYDDYTIWYNDTEYTILARQHASEMLHKPV